MRNKLFAWLCIPVLAGALTWAFLPNVPVAVRPAVVQPAATVAPALNKFELAQEQCVLIRNADKSSGSAVVVSCRGKLFAWTAAHVVSQVNTTKVVQLIRGDGAHRVGELSFDATVIARDADSDLAVLWIAHAPVKYFAIAHFSDAALPRVGAPVYHAGNFLGASFDRSVSAGIVSQLGILGTHWKTVDQANITVIFGSSGGPLFDENDNVLGLVVGLHSRIPGIAFFVPVREVENFAKEHSVTFALRGTPAPSDNVLLSFAKSAETVVHPPEPDDSCF